MFHIRYDGTMMDESRFVVVGGDSDAISERLEAVWQDNASLSVALGAAVNALAGPERTLQPGDLEVATLARGQARRAFQRLDDAAIGALLAPA